MSCFFQGAEKFKTRYATLGFSDQAALDDGDLWPTSYAINALTPAAEKQIIALVKHAVDGLTNGRRRRAALRLIALTHAARARPDCPTASVAVPVHFGALPRTDRRTTHAVSVQRLFAVG